MVQLSHPYMITVKTIALPRQTFVVKVMSLLFNTQSSSDRLSFLCPKSLWTVTAVMNLEDTSLWKERSKEKPRQRQEQQVNLGEAKSDISTQTVRTN